MRKNWLTGLLTTYTIKEINSPINGLIKIVMVFNRPRMIIGGLLQSGGLIIKLWDKAIKKLRKDKQRVKNALIIGLGCGDCAFSLERHYPGAKIMGIEIDEKIADLAQCYFNLATLKNLKINITDGVKYVEKISKQKKGLKYDLIVMDAYLGEKMSRAFRSEKFFNNLIKILDAHGVVIYNHLFFGKHKKRAGGFIKDLEKSFSKIVLQRQASNLLIFARK